MRKVFLVLVLCGIGQACQSKTGSSLIAGSEKVGKSDSAFVLTDASAAALYPILAIEETNTATSFPGGGHQLAKEIKELRCIHIKQFNEVTGLYNEDFSCIIDATAPEVSRKENTITITGPTAKAIYNAMNIEAVPLPISFQGGGSQVEKRVGDFACSFIDTFNEMTGEDVKVYACSFPDKRL